MKENRLPKKSHETGKPSVLLVTNSMQTGGAETHVVALASALMQKGCFVAVASAGGILVEELKKRGILHIEAPLNSRMPHCIIKSVACIRRAVKRYGFDIVHAHARLCAFVCQEALKGGAFFFKRRRLAQSVRLVTTAHLDFRLTPLLKRLTHWGERTLAVSEDLREYLIKGYGLSYESIDLTVNGIDTAHFNKKPTPNAIAKDKNEPYEIVHVSRIDKDRAMTAYLLVGLMPQLLKKRRVHLTIVGGGDLYYDLSLRAQRINLVYGDCIELVGEKDDVLPYLKRADIAVGVSRAALEAMACHLPTVLSGNDGYLGIYEKGKLDRAARGNFCCRGESKPTEVLLKKDIERLLDESPEKLALLGADARETVERYYSLDKMSEDHLKFYERLYPIKRKKHNKYAILGYHGFDNCGDDAVLGKMIEGIRENDRDAGITVLSHRPRKTERAFTVSAVSRHNPISILFTLISCEVLYVGGGTLLQTKTSKRSLYYYLTVIKLAKLFNKTVVYWGNGIGPLNTKEQLKVAKVLSTKSILSLRDEHSYYKALTLLGQIPEKKRFFWQENKKTRILIRTADSAATVLPCTRYHVEAMLGEYASHKYFVVATNGCLPKKWQKRYEKRIATVTSLAAEKGLLPIFLVMHPKKDEALTRRIAAHVKASGFKALVLKPSPREAAGLVSLAEFVLSSRLHPLIFASAFGTRAICYSDDEKCLQFAKEAFGEESRCRADTSDPHRLTEAVLSMLIVKTLPSRVMLFSPSPLYAEGMKSRAGELPEKLHEALLKITLEKKKESRLLPGWVKDQPT